MQYILTQAEYDKLQSLAEKGRLAPSEAELQKFCTRVANEMPAGVDWTGKEKPWGCILTTKTEWYCDSCPARKLCPHEPKRWSQ
jgi:hypothetical protein